MTMQGTDEEKKGILLVTEVIKYPSQLIWCTTEMANLHQTTKELRTEGIYLQPMRDDLPDF